MYRTAVQLPVGILAVVGRVGERGPLGGTEQFDGHRSLEGTAVVVGFESTVARRVRDERRCGGRGLIAIWPDAFAHIQLGFPSGRTVASPLAPIIERTPQSFEDVFMCWVVGEILDLVGVLLKVVQFLGGAGIGEPLGLGVGQLAIRVSL